jgi:hypothetical protein
MPFLIPHHQPVWDAVVLLRESACWSFRSGRCLVKAGLGSADLASGALDGAVDLQIGVAYYCLQLDVFPMQRECL